MNIFHTILQKLGIEKPAAPAPVTPAVQPAVVKPAAPAAVPAKPAETVPALIKPISSKLPADPYANQPHAAVPAAPVAVPVVDVVKKLEGLGKAHPELDWKVSIVDMLKLLEIDSSFEARKNLAVELGCPADQMSDSARMNIWLHKTVLQKIAENGGNIPKSMLD